MKRRTILSAALLMSMAGGVIHAQDSGTLNSKEAKKKVILGFKGGVNRSNVFDESGGEFVANPKVGFAGGAFLAVPFGSLLGFQPEILFTQKGFQGSGVIKGENYLISRTTNHLDIPLQLQVKPFAFFSALAGVQYSYLLSQTDRITYGFNSQEQSQEFANDNIRKNIFGAVIGFDINIGHMVLSGRSGWDLTSNHGDGTSSTPRYKNMWLQGTFGYRLY
jgi:hypothetical protein